MMMLGSIMAEYLPLLQEVMFISFYPFGICQIQVSVGRLKTSCMLTDIDLTASNADRIKPRANRSYFGTVCRRIFVRNVLQTIRFY